MNFKLKFTPEAEETYDALVDQLRQRWGNHFVNKFEVKILKCFDRIVINPDIYPVTDEITQVRRCLLHKNCSMLYKIYDDGTILIVCFWDNRQDPLII